MADGSGGHLSSKPELARYARVQRAGLLLFFAGVGARQADDSIEGASVGPTVAVAQLPAPLLAVELKAIASLE